MKELNEHEISTTSGGHGRGNIETIGYNIGKTIGDAGEWVYDNILIGDPWDEFAEWFFS